MGSRELMCFENNTPELLVSCASNKQDLLTSWSPVFGFLNFWPPVEIYDLVST